LHPASQACPEDSAGKCIAGGKPVGVLSPARKESGGHAVAAEEEGDAYFLWPRKDCPRCNKRVPKKVTKVKYKNDALRRKANLTCASGCGTQIAGIHWDIMEPEVSSTSIDGMDKDTVSNLQIINDPSPSSNTARDNQSVRSGRCEYISPGGSAGGGCDDREQQNLDLTREIILRDLDEMGFKDTSENIRVLTKCKVPDSHVMLISIT
jgi:hypothetical protein